MGKEEASSQMNAEVRKLFMHQLLGGIFRTTEDRGLKEINGRAYHLEITEEGEMLATAIINGIEQTFEMTWEDFAKIIEDRIASEANSFQQPSEKE